MIEKILTLFLVAKKCKKKKPKFLHSITRTSHKTFFPILFSFSCKPNKKKIRLIFVTINQPIKLQINQIVDNKNLPILRPTNPWLMFLFFLPWSFLLWQSYTKVNIKFFCSAHMSSFFFSFFFPVKLTFAFYLLICS